MLYLLAIILPFLAVMLVGRFWLGILLLIMQVLLIGWIPAVIVAWIIVSNVHTERRHQEMLAMMTAPRRES